MEIDFTSGSYTVAEDGDENKTLTMQITNGVTLQRPISVNLTGESLPDVVEAEMAKPGQDFKKGPVDGEIVDEGAGMAEVSLKDFIINDSRVESRYQMFRLEMEITDDGAYFDSQDAKKKSVDVAIECNDSEMTIDSEFTACSSVLHPLFLQRPLFLSLSQMMNSTKRTKVHSMCVWT